MTVKNNSNGLIEKIPSGVPGLDALCLGGLPKGRTTLVAGTSGSAKTIFAVQFLASGVNDCNENGVFVTFEEPPKDIIKNFKVFGWDLKRLEEEGRLAFVDASPQVGQETVINGEFDLGALMARIEYAVKKTGARRISLDSIGSLFTRFKSQETIRNELLRISQVIKELGLTAVITAERLEEYGRIARFEVEEFVADNVIILRNALEDEKRRRTLEILKFRGADHAKGEFPFTIIGSEGMTAIPLSAIELAQKSTDIRVTSGIPELDDMCNGGFHRDSIILASGATGTGKTLMVTHFLGGGIANGERALLFAFEESREQLFRNAKGWGYDFERMEAEGSLKVVCEYPEVRGLEDHYIKMRNVLEEFRPNRVAVDSLSALERVSTLKGFREFVIGMTSLCKDRQIAALFTSTTPSLVGGTSITEAHISTITDSIILLRYVEMYGEMQRGVMVLKMRGSMHDKNIRAFRIDGRGMHIGKPFRNVLGILAGSPSHIPTSEMEKLENLFMSSDG